MDLELTAELEDYRQEVRDFLKTHWVESANREEKSFRRAATQRGYLYRSYPRRYGGSEQEPDPVKALIIREEFEKVRAPREFTGNGAGLLAPTLLACAAEWQKEAFIEKTLSGEYRWAQGYSEPGAGSDLASVRTSAVLEGDEWVINGQKVWTSDAHNCQFMFALVRTEPNAPKHQGITYILLDMRQPGVTVRPLKQITGEAHFNEVFFDNARTPKDWIVGERGKGWEVSRATVEIERATVGSADGSAALFERLVKLAKSTEIDGRPAIKNPLIRDEMMKIHTMVQANIALSGHQLSLQLQRKPSGPATGALIKLYGTSITWNIALTAQKIMDHRAIGDITEGAPGPGRWVNQFMNSIAAQIGGGTSNIQRNVIAERGLGMPRDGAA
jgi:alkylation response protein AidB-like acyl-CoA dehydrogenase